MESNELAGENITNMIPEEFPKEDEIMQIPTEEFQIIKLNKLMKAVKEISDLHDRCFNLLKKYYGEDKIKLPIDIERIADGMGIQIKYENLNFGERDINSNIAQLRYEELDGTVIKMILVDDRKGEKRDIKKDPLSNLEKYAVAYELGKIIMDGEDVKNSNMSVSDMNMNSMPYSLPKLSSDFKSFEYEMCAIFLLLPRDLFLDEFKTFIETATKFPILMDEWISYLSKKTEIPNYQLINGYQFIKFCAYDYYVKNGSKPDFKYDMLFT